MIEAVYLAIRCFGAAEGHSSKLTDAVLERLGYGMCVERTTKTALTEVHRPMPDSRRLWPATSRSATHRRWRPSRRSDRGAERIRASCAGSGARTPPALRAAFGGGGDVMKALARAAGGAMGVMAWPTTTPRCPSRSSHGRQSSATERGKRIALTYDDGPNPDYTPELLELLARHNAHATFFQIGKWVEREPALAREVKEAGHAVGNHTFTHPTLALCSTERVQEELRRCHGASEAAGIEYSKADGASLMRCPWGRRRPGTLRAVKAAATCPCSGRSPAGLGRAKERPTTSADRCLKAREGDVILLHDGVHTDPARGPLEVDLRNAPGAEQLGARLRVRDDPGPGARLS